MGLFFFIKVLGLEGILGVFFFDIGVFVLDEDELLRDLLVDLDEFVK